MRKNIKSKITTIVIGSLLFSSPILLASDAAIVNAINQNKSAVTRALNASGQISVVDQLKAINQQVTSLFDNTFKGQFDSTTKKMTSLSTLDEKISLYAKYFYSWFTTTEFESLDFAEKIKENKDAIGKLQSQTISYNLEKSLLDKIKDGKALLAIPVENGPNNIDAASLGLSRDPAKNKGVSPYGSLADSTAITSKTVSVEDLIGPSKYADEEMQNKAKLYINYLIQTAPAPKGVIIPEKSSAINNKATVYLPYSGGDRPYTTISVSTKSGMFGQDSDYDKMIAFLNKDNRYQTLKAKTRATNVLRSLYLESMIRAYQNRVIDFSKKDDQSLVEKEREAAMAGLDKKYYEDLKEKSIADINLEILRSIKSLNYFLHKLHQDNELNSMMIGASAMRLATQDIQDELHYLKPIGTLIENRCWDLDNNASDQRKKACSDPIAASFMPKM